jgi:UDP-3-O-[3-hydroxymyristoyl] N-acetylglucosamine deacetylase|tara:strand:- start:6659 stop:7585 length:927 start_codon:yes stop_codon:yes gene_type:complete
VQNLNQKTILRPIDFEGIGLHSGNTSRVKILPANDNDGIIFKRIDLRENNVIKANFKNVSSAKLCTTLSNDFGTTVSTVEHLMAAFYITGIDNAIVEIDNSELPIMDGSSKDFVNLIITAGTKILFSKRKFLKIVKKVELKEENKYISIEPGINGLDVDFQLKYKNETIGNQKNHVIFNNENLEEIYSSRTFCLFEDIEKIKKIGLAKGGSLENAVVVKNDSVLNKDGLRNKKEFVNHKILDLVGDFMLSGYRILGSVKCNQGGHHLSNIFLKELFEDQSNFQELIINNINIVEKKFKTPANKLAVNA